MSDPIAPLSFLAGTNYLSKDDPGWTLLGEPSPGHDREYSCRVEFDREFSRPPVVHVGLCGFDIDSCDFARLRLAARHIDRAGFTVFLSTWYDSQVHGVEISWLAIGG